ncbi:DUF676 domain-containing protein [Fusarium falciforme]|uniref:DUF676 domain-containing protein n=1 Tax=Fusarium falciforme TaxID=195108 RepID=UPI0023008ECD|nr:DUF676 domain-containing protein [Fusarium falciforme]WAO86987.1 DUF676 domain-containing protein [Fusarium falciforme]
MSHQSHESDSGSLTLIHNRYGITEFSEGIPNNCKADIVFIHGLTGDSYSTWRHKNAELPWPEGLLAQDISNCKILKYDYKISAIGCLDNGTLRDLAADFLNELVNWRRDNESERPIIFVAHSLGGILVKRMLSESQSRDAPYNIGSLTRGIIFLGTAQRVSRLQDHGRRVLQGLRENKDDRNNRMEPNIELRAIFQPTSGILDNTHSLFMDWVGERNEDPSRPTVHIASFYGKLSMVKLPGLGEIKIVDRASALVGDYTCMGLQCNYKSMAKIPIDKTGSSYDDYCSVRAQIVNAVRLAKPKDELALGYTAEPSKDELEAWRECLQSFAFSDVRQRFETVSPHLEGTFEWIQDNNVFKYWLEHPRKNVFPLSGKRASGKSTFMKYLTRKEALVSWACKQNPSRHVMVLSHFFHYIGKDPSRTFEGFLRSILFQIVKTDLAAFEPVREIFDVRRLHQPLPTWPRDDLEEACFGVFKHWGDRMDDQRPNIYLVMDALDHFDGELHEMTSFLRKIFELSGGRLKICISSSQEKKIDNALANLESLGVLPRFEIDKHTRRDIEMYIEENYRELTEISVGEGKMLADVIRDHSRGVFLWVRLVCKNLVNCAITKTELARTPADELRRLLNKLQPDLEEVYEMMFKTIEPDVRHEVEKGLSIVVAASRRLSVEELQCAMYFSNHNNNNIINRTNINDKNNEPLSKISEEYLTHIGVFNRDLRAAIETRYRGFLEFTQNGSELIVEPCHGTAYTYLTERCKPQPQGPGEAFKDLTAYGENLLYESSTAYLSYLRREDLPPEASQILNLFADAKDDEQVPWYEGSVDNTLSYKWSTKAAPGGPQTMNILNVCSEYPFLSYSAENWGHHAKAGCSAELEPVRKLERDLFKGSSLTRSLWKLWELIIKARFAISRLPCFPGNWSYYPDADDSEEIEAFYVVEGDTFRCFLWVFWEHMEARRVNPYILSDLPLDALEYLSSTGCAGYLYRALARRPSKIRHPNRLLLSTIRAKSVPMVKRVLQRYSLKKLNVNFGEQAVFQAIDFSNNPDWGDQYELLVKALLDHGFPAHKRVRYTIRDEHWNTHREIQVLKRQFESSPLVLAILLHRHKIAELLLRHKSCKKAVRRDISWVLYRVLKMATEIQPANIKGIKLLLDKGASTKGVNVDSNMPQDTPLGIALSCKELAVAETLLAHGADANFRCDRASQLSVMAEAENDFPKRVPLLLRWGAEVDVWSMEEGCNKHPGDNMVKDVISVLMDHLYKKGDINRLIEDRETALHIAIRYGRKDLVKRLIQKLEADVNIPDRNGDFPIHVALRQAKAMAHIKLLQGSPSFSPSVLNHDGRTAFQQAKFKGQSSLVRELRECGLGEGEQDSEDEEDPLEDPLAVITYPRASETKVDILRLEEPSGGTILRTRPVDALHGINEFIRGTDEPWNALRHSVPQGIRDVDPNLQILEIRLPTQPEAIPQESESLPLLEGAITDEIQAFSQIQRMGTPTMSDMSGDEFLAGTGSWDGHYVDWKRQ